MQESLVWTKNKPAETGYYWHRSGKTLNIFRAIHTDRGLAIVVDRDTMRDIAEMRGEWAGPIPYPAEPAAKPSSRPRRPL